MAVAGVATREWQGVQFPTAGTWTVDPTHTAIEFQVKHLMIAKVKGRFADFEGALTIADDPTRSTVDLRIRAASIDTRTQQRDDHLRSPDFFGADKYPELSFTSTAVEHADGDDWKIRGDLTIHGVTGLVTPWMVRSPRIFQSSPSACSTAVLVKLRSGYLSAPKKSGERR